MTLTGNIVTIISKLCNIQCTISPLRPLRATYASSSLKSILQNKIPRHREEVRKLRDKHGSVKLGEVTVDMIYGGMRGLTPLVCETSWIDLDEGVKFRGLSIPECERRMPKADGSDQPLPEGLFWLLLTGDVPTLEQAKDLSEEWASRADVPSHVVTMLSNMPKTLHPMSQLSAAVTTLNNDSKFAKAYCEGVHKSKYWEYVLEDSMDLLAKLPVVAALIYRNVYHAGRPVMPVDCNRDWAANFCHMLGFHEHGFDELMRLHLFIHGDHGSGNVSAHTAHLVGSALSDPYLAWAAGINGFAGPLHGVANQEAVLWLEKLLKEAGDNPTDDQLNKFVRKTLDSGQVVPGFGHAVLRKTDQRYISNRKFALKHLPDDPLFKLVEALYRVVPPILMETGRIKNPWPNADAVTGIILKHYGLHEARYCPVLLCVSRALGVLAQMVWARALGLPIERPDSLTTDLIAQRIQQRNDEQSDCYLIF